ncbi:MAG: hypothetical protein RIR39_195 [Pseudomonadota bacterium]
MKNTFFISLAALLLSGCTQTFVTQLAPQSHFAYPNSNLYPLGHVSGRASKTSFGMPDMSSALQYEAIANALEQKPGADLLLNSIHLMDVTQLLILPIVTVTYRVEGSAAKMTTGHQTLH